MENRKKALYSLLGKTVHVEIDRPIGTIHKGMTYPVNYGYIPGMMAGDGEEQDAYILGITEPLSSFDGQVVGAILRKNDVEDKLIVAPTGMLFHQGQIAQATHFQEQYFDTVILSLFRRSCGVLAYRCRDDIREYLLVFETYSQCWSLPKGHMESGETAEETALRELWEETGLTAALDATRSAVIEYPIPPVGRKQVLFFPGEVRGTPRTRPGEIQSYKWVTADQLPQYLFADTVEAIRSIL